MDSPENPDVPLSPAPLHPDVPEYPLNPELPLHADSPLQALVPLAPDHPDVPESPIPDHPDVPESPVPDHPDEPDVLDQPEVPDSPESPCPPDHPLGPGMATPEAMKLLMSMTSGRCTGSGRYPEQASILITFINLLPSKTSHGLLVYPLSPGGYDVFPCFYYPITIASNLT